MGSAVSGQKLEAKQVRLAMFPGGADVADTKTHVVLGSARAHPERDDGFDRDRTPGLDQRAARTDVHDVHGLSRRH